MLDFAHQLPCGHGTTRAGTWETFSFYQTLTRTEKLMSFMSLSRLSQLFAEQRDLVSYFFDKFDCQLASDFVELALSCKGTLIFSGVGKSGFIANKIAMSLSSTGTKSTFLNPLDALHGDIGLLSGEDILVLLSKSGSTQELLQLIPVARNKNAKVVAITCREGSKLALESDLNVHLPLARELCPFNMAPVTSTVVQLIFGDTVTVALMEARQLDADLYAMNHPAGSIGRNLLHAVKDSMRTSDLPCVQQSTTLKDALVVMSEGMLGCVFVLGTEGCLKGIFTDGDLRRCLNIHGCNLLNHSVAEHMNPKPRTISKDTKLKHVAASFRFPFPVQCLAVVETNDDVIKVIGALSCTAVSQALA